MNFPVFSQLAGKWPSETSSLMTPSSSSESDELPALPWRSSIALAPKRQRRSALASLQKGQFANSDRHPEVSRAAPGGGANLPVGIRASSNHGFPPPRIVNSAVRRKPARAPNSSVVMLVPVNPFQPAGRKTTPSSVWPVVTKRQSAMSSLRASATIIVLRVPARRSAVRAWYHRASALSF